MNGSESLTGGWTIQEGATIKAAVEADWEREGRAEAPRQSHCAEAKGCPVDLNACKAWS